MLIGAEPCVREAGTLKGTPLSNRLRAMSLRNPIQPCLPLPAKEPPSGPGWIHEIKHDGFRILARRDGDRVRLYTRNGYDFADRFPRIVEAVKNLPVGSCIIDGEAIVIDPTGLSVFDLLRYRQHDHAAVLCAFDLIEVDGRDLRSEPIEERKHGLANVLYRKREGVIFNQHYDGDGAIIFKQACALGCEGIVSKRLGSLYRSGRVNHWLKIKNPTAPAVKREAEEDWGIKRWGRGRRQRVNYR
jgi:bifunctional non-homologous end joining protein LigD